MKKVVFAFSVAWAIFSVINTGYEVLQPKWREKLKMNPHSVQASVGDIYSRGAVAVAYKPRPSEATLFVDQESGLLKGLPLIYWLSPTYIAPLYNQPGGIDAAAIDSHNKLREALERPSSKMIYFVGSPATLKANSSLLQNFKQTTITTSSDGLVFVTLERIK